MACVYQRGISGGQNLYRHIDDIENVFDCHLIIWRAVNFSKFPSTATKAIGTVCLKTIYEK